MYLIVCTRDPVGTTNGFMGAYEGVSSEKDGDESESSLFDSCLNK